MSVRRPSLTQRSAKAQSRPSAIVRIGSFFGLRKPESDTRDRDRPGDYGVRLSAMHVDEDDAGVLHPGERRQLSACTLFGTTGALLMLVGSLGTGEQPVIQNPIAGMRLLSLPSRMWSTSLTLTLIGMVMMVIAWLMLGRFAVGKLRTEVARSRKPERRMSRRQADKIMVAWTLPFLVMPPMLSKDVYSYLAQSEITYRGMDPYTVSPAAGLGVDHVFTRSVPTVWRDTPAPYGPLFLSIGQGITRLTGDNIPAGVIAHRMVAMVGVALIVWALPRLARQCGVSDVAALWLGAMNPLVIFHFVGGIHNDALMMGLMLVGMEFCLRAISSANRLRTPGGFRPTPTGWLLIGGGVVIAASAMIKITSILALGFVGVALARRWGATLPALRHAPIGEYWQRSKRSVAALAAAAAFFGSILVVVTVTLCLGTGLGFGWTSTLGTANVVRSWMSLPTMLAVISGNIGALLGLGDHSQSVLDLARPLAQLIALLIIVRWLLAQLAGRLHPVGALGISMTTLVLFFPVVQPWYLVWAILPLAAWATGPRFRIAAILITTLISVVILPNGAPLRGLQFAEACIAAIITVALMMVIFFDNPILRRRHRAADEDAQAASPATGPQR